VHSEFCTKAAASPPGEVWEWNNFKHKHNSLDDIEHPATLISRQFATWFFVQLNNLEHKSNLPGNILILAGLAA